MTADRIQRALTDITAETDPTLRHLKLASLVCAVFRERGIELVVVGGSAIEFYTEGAYVSGDLDLCLVSDGNGLAGSPPPCGAARIRDPACAGENGC